MGMPFYVGAANQVLNNDPLSGRGLLEGSTALNAVYTYRWLSMTCQVAGVAEERALINGASTKWMSNKGKQPFGLLAPVLSR